MGSAAFSGAWVYGYSYREGTLGMTERNRFGVGRIAPWRGTVAWWVVFVEGMIALVVGLYVLVQPQQASTWIVQLIGAYFLVNSGFALYAGFSGSGPAHEQPFRLIVSGIGLVIGLLALTQPLLGTIDALAAITMLGVGLLLAGIIGLVGLIIGRVGHTTPWGRVLASSLDLLLGILLLYLSRTGTTGNALLLLGLVGLGMGVLLVAYAVMLYRRSARSP
jgi:uncharacterized membrane protein HdeD (DUF308 family)